MQNLNTATMKQVVKFVEGKTHFFSKEAKRFFSSFISRNALQAGQEVFFITSEQFRRSDGSCDARRYTIRCVNLESGQVKTVGEFQQYANRKTAWRALNKHLASLGYSF